MELLGGTTLAAKGRDSVSLDEHQAIVEAIAARDEAGAEAALRRHISMAYETRLKEDARLNDEGGA